MRAGPLLLLEQHVSLNTARTMFSAYVLGGEGVCDRQGDVEEKEIKSSAV